MSVSLVHLEVCETTQSAARERARAGHGRVVAVLADSQRAGRGREQRSWHDPPGDAVLLSIARIAAMSLAVLEDLPRFVADCVRASIAEQVGDTRASALGWKPPNDIVAVDGGAKVGGILVDARTRGTVVEEVVVGIGLNTTGAPFTVSDGRAATSIEAATGGAVDRIVLAAALAARIARRLEVGPI